MCIRPRSAPKEEETNSPPARVDDGVKVDPAASYGEHVNSRLQTNDGDAGSPGRRKRFFGVLSERSREGRLVEVDWNERVGSAPGLPQLSKEKDSQNICANTISNVCFRCSCLRSSGRVSLGGVTGSDGAPVGRTTNALSGRAPHRSDLGEAAKMSRSSWSSIWIVPYCVGGDCLSVKERPARGVRIRTVGTLTENPSSMTRP